jgi:hypothetical protein
VSFLTGLTRGERISELVVRCPGNRCQGSGVLADEWRSRRGKDHLASARRACRLGPPDVDIDFLAKPLLVDVSSLAQVVEGRAARHQRVSLPAANCSMATVTPSPETVNAVGARHGCRRILITAVGGDVVASEQFAGNAIHGRRLSGSLS